MAADLNRPSGYAQARAQCALRWTARGATW